MESLSSRRPYLLRATYEWLTDNMLTPYILVDASVAGVEVPEHTIKDGQVVLNISMNAANNLELANDAISFQARFAGKVELIYLPIEAVVAVYAKENQEGLVLPPDELVEETTFSDENAAMDISNIKPSEPVKKSKPGLHLVK